ncbi:MAG: hypothetical protein HYT08_03585 [Candidatus Levybacteria bacterium]|nr:hypothetical protein [Candidatus Levybacteria bacterium]
MRVEAICGNCQFFDRNRMDGSSVGKIVTDGKKIAQGLCRINNGLIMQTRQENSVCKQPDGIFKSIELKSPQVSPEVV